MKVFKNFRYDQKNVINLLFEQTLIKLIIIKLHRKK